MSSDRSSIYTLSTRTIMYNNLPKGGIGAEIGVCQGVNSCQLWMMSRPKKMYLVDLWEFQENTAKNHPIELVYNDYEFLIRWMFSNEIASGQISIQKKNSIQFLDEIQDDHLDWVYLDGDHHYENILSEIKLCCRKVKSGGVISGHDFASPSYSWSGVSRAVLECAQNGLISVEALTMEEFSSFSREYYETK